MKKVWHWLVRQKKTLGKIGLAYLALELLAAVAALLGARALLP